MQSVIVVAETSINHNGDTELLKKMIDSAWACGVDWIKFQKYKTDEFMTPDNQNYNMFKSCEFTDSQWIEIIKYCDSKEINYFFTPQNKTDLDFLNDNTKVRMIKIGSDDLTNLELIEYCARYQKPMILSTGMSYEYEISNAVKSCFLMGNKDVTLLHCTSSYPTYEYDVNMLKLDSLKEFSCKIGYSDHTVGNNAALMAVSLGAVMIEKHFTIDNNLISSDQWFSANPREMQHLVDSIRNIELMFGSSSLEPTTQEIHMRKVARRTKNEKGVYLRETI